jgi:hypothetical protein
MKRRLFIKIGILVFLIGIVSYLFQVKIQAYQGESGDNTAKLEIKSDAFEEGSFIPKKYTCDGANVSPPLSWSSVPAGTKSLALVCDDPDAPAGTWVHWVIFGLSPETVTLPEDIPKKMSVLGRAKQGINDFGKLGYGGPCPPRGNAHRYFFKIYALDTQPDLNAGVTKQELLKAMEGHIIGKGQLIGRYQR